MGFFKKRAEILVVDQDLKAKIAFYKKKCALLTQPFISGASA